MFLVQALVDMGIEVAETQESNMVRFHVNYDTMDCDSVTEFQNKLASEGILVGAVEGTLMRVVFHNDVNEEGLEKSINAFSKMMKQKAN